MDNEGSYHSLLNSSQNIIFWSAQGAKQMPYFYVQQSITVVLFGCAFRNATG